jgi:hypothetical protein
VTFNAKRASRGNGSNLTSGDLAEGRIKFANANQRLSSKTKITLQRKNSHYHIKRLMSVPIHGLPIPKEGKSNKPRASRFAKAGGR